MRWTRRRARRARQRVRRNRAVPISRRWDQVLGDDSRATVAIKPGTPGRTRISRRAIAQGMPVDLAKPVVTAACVFCCRRAMGAACTRHSLCPLTFWGTPTMHHSGKSCRENAKTCPVRCLKTESGNLQSCGRAVRLRPRFARLHRTRFALRSAWPRHAKPEGRSVVPQEGLEADAFEE